MIKKQIRCLPDFRGFPSLISRKKRLLCNYLRKEVASPPMIIYIAINSVCNLQCKMCDVGQKQKDTQFFKNMVSSGLELSLDTLQGLVDDVKITKPVIAVTSTEPLLFKDLFTFARYVVNQGLEIQITTNGYLLEQFAREIVDIPVTDLSISLDGPAEIHNSIRGRGNSFDRALQGIGKIIEQKKEKHKTRPRIHLNYTISNYNYHTLLTFVESVKNLDIQDITFSHLNFITNEMAWKHNKEFGSRFPATPSSISSVNLAEINIDVLYDQIQQVKNMHQNCSFIPELTKDQLTFFYQKPEIFLNKHTHCRIPWNAAQIFANGDVGVSTRCFNITFGNIYDENFSKIWNGERMRNFRNELLRCGAFPACARCCGVF